MHWTVFIYIVAQALLRSVLAWLGCCAAARRNRADARLSKTAQDLQKRVHILQLLFVFIFVTAYTESSARLNRNGTE